MFLLCFSLERLFRAQSMLSIQDKTFICIKLKTTPNFQYVLSAPQPTAERVPEIWNRGQFEFMVG